MTLREKANLHSTRFSDRWTKWNSWLENPLSNFWCVLGWLGATAIFVSSTTLSGGLTEGDSNVSVYAAWAIAHGHLSCAYLPSGAVGYAPTAPIYPLLSSALVSIFRVGHSVAFPNSAQLGQQCSMATSAITHWALHSSAWSPTLRIGYIGWLVMTAGVVALLRVSGRGRCRWEPIALLMLALAPPVSMCLVEYFHPQDLIALGLALGALASARTGRWFYGGLLMGLAIVSQQFSWLVVVPLVVVAPRNQLTRFVGGTILSALSVAVPLVVLTSGRAITSVLVGTGESSVSNSWLDQTNIHGSPLFVISRFFPLALALVLAWWATQRLGPQLLEPIPLVSLIATSLGLRLVFEVNLWGYYFMALTVLLIALDVIRGRIRISLVGWILLVTLAADYGGLFNNPAYQPLPIWFLQITLVSSALALAVGPLISFTKDYPKTVLETKKQINIHSERPRNAI